MKTFINSDLLNLFRQQLQLNLTALGKAIAAGDMKACGAVAHKGRGSALTFGFTELAQLFQKVEEAAAAPGTTPDDLARCLAELDAAAARSSEKAAPPA